MGVDPGNPEHPAPELRGFRVPVWDVPRDTNSP